MLDAIQRFFKKDSNANDRPDEADNSYRVDTSLLGLHKLTQKGENQTVIVALDIDETIAAKVFNKTNSGKSLTWLKYFHHLRSNYCWQEALRHLVRSYVKLHYTNGFVILDPRIEHEVNTMVFSPHVHIIGLTARKYQDKAKTLNLFRVLLPKLHGHLTSNGIPALKEKEGKFDTVGAFNNIIYTHRYPKHEVLFEMFVKEMDDNDPPHFIFVDNLEGNVGGMQAHLAKHGFTFDCIHLNMFDKILGEEIDYTPRIMSDTVSTEIEENLTLVRQIVVNKNDVLELKDAEDNVLFSFSAKNGALAKFSFKIPVLSDPAKENLIAQLHAIHQETHLDVKENEEVKWRKPPKSDKKRAHKSHKQEVEPHPPEMPYAVQELSQMLDNASLAADQSYDDLFDNPPPPPYEWVISQDNNARSPRKEDIPDSVAACSDDDDLERVSGHKAKC